MSPLASLNARMLYDSSDEYDEHVPVTRPKFHGKKRAPHIDKYGLEQPAPPSNLWRGDNVDRYTKRRVYDKEARRLLPFHHEPETRVGRRWRSTSAMQAYEALDVRLNEVIDRSHRDGTNENGEIQRLLDVENFVKETERLQEWDETPHNRSLEDRMEDLLKVYGFDKMKPSDYELRKQREAMME
ncbi:MAG: hypothetical protein Q9218_006027 [Villophora microphyllina]